MKRITRAVLVLALTFWLQTIFAQDTEAYTKVANRFLELFNAADYAGIQNLFDKEMSKALPPNKATDLFKGITSQLGKIQTFDAPRRNGGWTVFPAQFERGRLDLSLALNGEKKIAGILFKPGAAAPVAAANGQAEMQSYVKVASRLVELINAADYPGVENLFAKEMSQVLPLKAATEFFAGITGQVGTIQKLDEPKRTANGVVFPAHCERGMLDVTLILDGESKIAGLEFKPRAASTGVAPKTQLTEFWLPGKGRWLVFWGGDTKELNHHHDIAAQRFAFDLVGVDESGETHRGDGAKNEDYFAFGREIMAPADGVVVEAIDGVRDNTPGSMNPYSLIGNCVVIQHRTNEFSVLAHLQRGSVAVKAGEQVKRGQLLGKCGNSGNSSEPHLHFQAQDSSIFQDAFGVKVLFQKVFVAGAGQKKMKTNYSPVKGDVISAQ